MEIRKVTGREALGTCVRIEEEVWGSETVGRVDVAHLERAVADGGILIGAFYAARPVGFVFSYRIDIDGRGVQHSHLLAVLPPFRGRGLGTRLKLAQRKAARTQGDVLIVWTFDPLESVNGNLNMNRLGASARRYLVDFYGETGSPLHAGLRTDRLLTEWTVESPPDQAADGPGAGEPASPHPPSPTIAVRWRDDTLPEPVALDRWCQGDTIAVPVPPSIQELKRRDPALARTWRRRTAESFIHYFQFGYAVCGFQVSPDRFSLPAYLLRQFPRGSGYLTDRLDLTGVPFGVRCP